MPPGEATFLNCRPLTSAVRKDALVSDDAAKLSFAPQPNPLAGKLELVRREPQRDGFAAILRFRKTREYAVGLPGKTIVDQSDKPFELLSDWKVLYVDQISTSSYAILTDGERFVGLSSRSANSGTTATGATPPAPRPAVPRVAIDEIKDSPAPAGKEKTVPPPARDAKSFDNPFDRPSARTSPVPRRPTDRYITPETAEEWVAQRSATQTRAGVYWQIPAS